MKKILIALLICFSFVTANAKDYSKYYQNLSLIHIFYGSEGRQIQKLY